MLALGGIGSAVLFSGFSQVLRSNAEVVAITSARQQLNAAGQTLSAASVLDTPTSTILLPPAALAFASLPDTARLPTDFANLGSTGLPTSYGVLDVTSGARQLDPWGKYYLYCRWEHPIASPALPSIMVISAGPDGVSQTRCGDTAAQGDDRANTLSVAEAVNRANVWQVTSNNQIKFGIASNAVQVNDDGSMQAGSLSLLSPLAVTSGGTGATTAAAARSNLGVPDFTGNGASGSWNIDIAGNAATATRLLHPRLFSVAGTTGLLAASQPFDGASNVALVLTGTLALTSGGTGATTAPQALTNLGGTVVGKALFTATDQSGGRTALGAGITGDSLFTAANALAARTTLELGTLATQNANAVAVTGGTITAVDLTGSTIPASGIIGAVTNATNAGTVPATGITGCCLSIASGGTGQATAAGALVALGGTNATNLTSGTLSTSLLPDSGVVAGSYNWGTVNAKGLVTAAYDVTTAAVAQGDTSIGVSDSGSNGTIAMTVDGVAMAAITSVGVGIGTATPIDALDVNGNGRLRGPAGTNRSLIYSTLGSQRWALSSNSAAEVGSNAGSNFVITRYSDAGASLGDAVSVARNTGAVSLSNDLTVAGAVTATGGFYGTFNGSFLGAVGAAGASGQVQFNYAGTLAADAALHWDNTGKLLGIGTATPRSSVHIYTAAVASAPYDGAALVEAETTNAKFIAKANSETSSPIFAGYFARGTLASPAPPQAGDTLVALDGGGFTGADWTSRAAAIRLAAAETWSPSARGSAIRFRTTPLGSTLHTERLIIDADGNIGIGTSVPVRPISVHSTGHAIIRTAATTGTAYVSGMEFYRNTLSGLLGGGFIRVTSDTTHTNGLLELGACNNCGANTGSTMLVIADTGHVGIGTTNPTTALDILGNGAAGKGVVSIRRDGQSPHVDLISYGSPSTVKTYYTGRAASGSNLAPGLLSTGDTIAALYAMPFDGTNFSNVTGAIQFYHDGVPTSTSLPTAVRFGTTPAGSKSDVIRLTINSLGNVGIGTTTPLSLLDVRRGAAGTAGLDATAASAGIFMDAVQTATYRVLIGVGERGQPLNAAVGSYDDGNTGAQGLFLATGNNTALSEVVRITSTGKVGIGSTLPAATLDIAGFIKLQRNSSAPAVCSATNDGAMAMTSGRALCVCDGAAWTNLVGGGTCNW